MYMYQVRMTPNKIYILFIYILEINDEVFMCLLSEKSLLPLNISFGLLVKYYRQEDTAMSVPSCFFVVIIPEL